MKLHVDDRLSMSICSNSSNSSFNNLLNSSNQESNSNQTLQRIKHLFLIFLRQFDSEEFILLAKYLRFLLNKHKLNPNKIFNVLLDSEKCKKKQYPNIIKNESLNNINQIKENKEDDENDENIVYLDEEDLLKDKSDIIKSFSVQKDSDLDQRSEFELKYEDFNYFNNQLTDEDDDDNHKEEDVEEDDEKNQLNDEYEDLDENDLDENDDDFNLGKTKVKSSKRTRKFNDFIRTELENKFSQNNFISGVEKKSLAKKLKLSESQIQKWFVHRREKQRKDRLSNNKNLKNKSQIDKRIKSIRNNDAADSNSSKCKISDNNKENKSKNQIEFNDKNLASTRSRRFRSNEEGSETVQLRRVNQHRQSLIEKHQDEANLSESSKRITRNTKSKIEKLDEIEDLKSPPAKRACNLSQNLSNNKRGFSQDIVDKLETYFQKENYVNEKQLNELIETTDLNETQIKSWFMQRRYRQKIDRKSGPIKANRRSSKDQVVEEDSSNLNDKKEDNLDDDNKQILNNDLNSDLNLDLNENTFMNAFSKSVNDELEKTFQKSKYLNLNEKKNLCTKLNLKNIDVERWFYFKRKQQK